jgi:hypothetical protein
MATADKAECRITEDRIFNPLNAELNPICHLLALLGGATIVVVSRLRVKALPYVDFEMLKKHRAFFKLNYLYIYIKKHLDLKKKYTTGFQIS